MGYTTDFKGKIKVTPKLNQEEIDYLNKFSETRRMECDQGPYYVDRGGFMGQDDDQGKVKDYNRPPLCQPGLWCQWVPTECGEYIEWNETEKFYYSVEWMEYLIAHFIGPSPIAISELSFLKGHTLAGKIKAQGESHDDTWTLVVEDSQVSIVDLSKDGQVVECPHCEEKFTLPTNNGEG